jgi:hypothetical protein
LGHDRSNARPIHATYHYLPETKKHINPLSKKYRHDMKQLVVKWYYIM